MATIVGVHGIGKYPYYREAGNSPEGAAAAMRDRWNRYLRAGLAGTPHATGSPIAEVAYYAHHLNRPRQGRLREARSMDADAQRVFIEWAVQLDGIKDTAGESLTGALRWATEWLMKRLEHRTAAFARLFCPEVAAYLESPSGQARVLCQRAVVEAVRRHEPKVVIAHSLGSVVAYEALHAHPDLKVELLITLGSPLAMRDVVFERLLPAPLNGRGTRPPRVGRWVNIADPHDVVAIPAALGGSFTGVDQDCSVDLDWIDFHTVRGYLGCGALASFLRPYL